MSLKTWPCCSIAASSFSPGFARGASVASARRSGVYASREPQAAALTRRSGNSQVITQELHDQAQLPLAKQWFDRAHDPAAAADRDPLADLERLLAAEMAG